MLDSAQSLAHLVTWVRRLLEWHVELQYVVCVRK